MLFPFFYDAFFSKSRLFYHFSVNLTSIGVVKLQIKIAINTPILNDIKLVNKPVNIPRINP